jgi:hypothetical protein
MSFVVTAKTTFLRGLSWADAATGARAARAMQARAVKRLKARRVICSLLCGWDRS